MLLTGHPQTGPGQCSPVHWSGLTIRKAVRVHTHFSAMSALAVFLVVVIVGTAWRLGSLRLASSKSPAARTLGAAMHFQY